MRSTIIALVLLCVLAACSTENGGSGPPRLGRTVDGVFVEYRDGESIEQMWGTQGFVMITPNVAVPGSGPSERTLQLEFRVNGRPDGSETGGRAVGFLRDGLYVTSPAFVVLGSTPLPSGPITVSVTVHEGSSSVSTTYNLNLLDAGEMPPNCSGHPCFLDPECGPRPTWCDADAGMADAN